jgi:chromate transporter
LSSTPLSLRSLFGIFFRIACTSFGGFMAVISVVENVIVERRKLLAHQDMLDGISLAQLLPGPMAVNVCAYVGYRLHGMAGALLASLALILPGFVLIVILAYVYFTIGEMPVLTRLFQGFIPAVTAVIVAAAWNMARKTVTGVVEGLIMAAAAAALLMLKGFFVTIGVMVAAGAIGWAVFRGEPEAPAEAKPAPEPKPGTGANLVVLGLTPAAPVWLFEPGLVLKVFAVFGGMSVMLFGSGYVFIPMMQQVLVAGENWLTPKEFVDGIALGQIMPGAILVSAAFFGFKIAGFAGALAATVGIFGPPALLMVAASRAFDRLRRLATVAAVLRGVRPAVVGMIAAAAWLIGQTAAPVWLSAAIFAAALIALLRFRRDVIWIVPPAGFVGMLFF